MTRSSPLTGPILLATDLSPRCDRALDRAVYLAKLHATKLIVLHVIEPSFLSQFVLPSWGTAQQQHQDTARKRLFEDLAHTDVDLEVLVEFGHCADVIDEVSLEHQCALIITGTARDEALGRVVLGSTTERLARRSNTPLLVVRRRPFEAYRHVLVGTDFSEGAGAALNAVLDWVPHERLTLLHALEPASEGYDNTPQTFKATEAQLQTFLESVAPDNTASRISTVVEEGLPGEVIPAYAQSHSIDLVALGTRGAAGIVKTGMGSVAEHLLILLRCDVLLLPT